MKIEGMAAQTILNVVGFMTSGLILLLGIALLVGFMIPSYIPSGTRIITGVVMVLYGGYRISMIIVKQRNAKRREEDIQ